MGFGNPLCCSVDYEPFRFKCLMSARGGFGDLSCAYLCGTTCLFSVFEEFTICIRIMLFFKPVTAVLLWDSSSSSSFLAIYVLV